jgi:hypothetical protein
MAYVTDIGYYITITHTPVNTSHTKKRTKIEGDWAQRTNYNILKYEKKISEGKMKEGLHNLYSSLNIFRTQCTLVTEHG